MPAADPPLLTAADRRLFEEHPEAIWTWSASPGACDACQALDGQQFSYNDVPERPHPNCKCTVAVDPTSLPINAAAEAEVSEKLVQDDWLEGHRSRWEKAAAAQREGRYTIFAEAEEVPEAIFNDHDWRVFAEDAPGEGPLATAVAEDIRYDIFGDAGGPIFDPKEGPLGPDLAEAFQHPTSELTWAQAWDAPEPAPWEANAPEPPPMCTDGTMDWERRMCVGHDDPDVTIAKFVAQRLVREGKLVGEAEASTGSPAALEWEAPLEYADEPVEDEVEFFNRAWQAHQENDSFQMASSFSLLPIKLTYNWDGEVDIDFQIGTLIGVNPIEWKQLVPQDPSDHILPPGTLSGDTLFMVPGASATIDDSGGFAIGADFGLPFGYTTSPQAVGSLIQGVAKPAADAYQKFVRFNMGKGWDDSSP